MGPSRLGGRMRYSSRRQSTPPMPRTRFRLARMRSGRVTPRVAAQEMRGGAAALAAKETSERGPRVFRGPGGVRPGPGPESGSSARSLTLALVEMAPVSVPAPPPSRPVSSSSKASSSKARASFSAPPTRFPHGGLDTTSTPPPPGRSVTGPSSLEIRRNLERGVGVSRPRLGERRVVEIRAIAVREMDEVLHPGGSRGALREAQARRRGCRFLRASVARRSASRRRRDPPPVPKSPRVARGRGPATARTRRRWNPRPLARSPRRFEPTRARRGPP